MSDLHLLLSEAGVKVTREPRLRYAVVDSGFLENVFADHDTACDAADALARRLGSESVNVVPFVEFDPINFKGVTEGIE